MIAAGQTQYNPYQYQFQNPLTNPFARLQPQKKEEVPRSPSLEHYLPAVSEEMMQSLGGYQDWAKGEMPTAPDMVSYFQGAAPDYTPYQWQDLSKYYERAAPTYQNFDFTAPEYQKADASAYEYTPTNIEDVQDISGVPKGIWDELISSEEERIGKGYKGQREQVADYLARTGGEGRSGARDAMMASLSGEEEDAKTAARRELAAQRALQEVGVAQQTQSLKATRGVEQAALESKMKESQAAEMARVQGIDIDEARYAVDQQWKEKEAQATEKKYGYEQGTAKTQFLTGLKRQTDEDKAAEASKAYEASYGKAQDVAGLMGTQHQQSMSDWSQKGQALLSGAQLAQGATSQAGSYNIQKETDTGDDDYWKQANQATANLNPQGAQTTTRRYGMPSVNVTKTNAQARSAAAAKLAQGGGAYA